MEETVNVTAPGNARDALQTREAVVAFGGGAHTMAILGQLPTRFRSRRSLAGAWLGTALAAPVTQAPQQRGAFPFHGWENRSLQSSQHASHPAENAPLLVRAPRPTSSSLQTGSSPSPSLNDQRLARHEVLSKCLLNG